MKRHGFPLILIVSGLLISAIAYPSLPEQFAIHWGPSGEVDGFANKSFGAFFMPLLLIGLYGLFLVLPHIDPRKRNYDKFLSSYRITTIVTLSFLWLIHVLIVLYNAGVNINIDMAVHMGVGALLIILGNYMPRFRHNFFVGIKTPWTLASEKVWMKTHRVGGWVFIAMGIAIMATSLVEGIAAFILLLSIVLSGAAIVTVLSYLYYKEEDLTQ
ncbi:membrane protein [Pontibacillus halophilus JSM 076056 = DSM 19796]|uniref:Membrane protein n=1 Tax=Pontibacillus halophilus JSM 076056 = DSM 19796 TaxID=1385510 RepID=A0A0A5GP44_9BACI|nr:DUF1648 domain-containing protein [Pontibacillus halophilus]KGX93769.1 membrane protein [Pontibacillus halophilus JSM 076056 = DSM 19796]